MRAGLVDDDNRADGSTQPLLDEAPLGVSQPAEVGGGEGPAHRVRVRTPGGGHQHHVGPADI